MFLRLTTTLILLVAVVDLAFGQTQYPLGLAQAADGTKYIVDLKLRGVWKSSGGKLSVLVQQAPKRIGKPLYAARCIALDKDGNVLVGDSATREVYRVDPAGKLTPLTGGGIGTPMSIAVAKDGTIYVADLELHRIFKVPHEGGKATPFVDVKAPRGLAIDSKDNLIVLSTREDQIHRISPKGKDEVILKGRPFELPHNIAIASDGAMYVTDGLRAKAVWKVSADGKTEKLISGDPLVNPVGISVDDDHLLVVDSRANAVFKLSFDGKTVSKLDLGKR